MWIKKSEPEIVEDEKRKRKITIRNGILFCFFLSIFCIGHRIPTALRANLGWNFIWTRIITAERVIVSVLVSGILSYIFFRFLKKKPKILICPKCEATKSPDGTFHCSCGGEFVDISNVKWMKHS